VFVNQNVTYEADAIDQWKLPWETLRDGCGDCEDMAVLGLSILRNMGVESYMAVELGHVLAAIPDSDGYVYIEMTAEKYPWGVEAHPYVILPSGWNVYAVAMLGVYTVLLIVLAMALRRK
jgi:transglutaminase-like putative cysteine protease